MPVAYIGLGSNLGDRRATLDAAVRRLEAEPGLRFLRVSGYYETAPVDCPPASGDYLNAAAAVETDRDPKDILRLLQQIERQFGRVRTGVNSPRTVDLDILLYGDRVIDTPDLVVPHPRMHERAFVIEPLLDIAADTVHPVLGKTIRELRGNVPPENVRPIPCPVPPATDTLRGMSALVTGSTRGIGRAICSAMSTAGAFVLTHGRREPPPPPQWAHLAADLSDPEACDRLADAAWEKVRGLDIVVLNAGADTLTGDAASWSFDQKLDALLAVDLKATMRLGRNLGARMKARGRGVILTVGWDQAETGMEGDSGELFAAVKGAVMCFTRSLALSLAPEVRVNCLAPGWIRTAWGESASPTWQERVRRETPLGVWGLPEDVAAAAVWLASPAAGFVTGQTYRVNGGAVRA
ncbi:2-amino-4-hydroxy-6-hydroxymethyldihydropteridine diphosphokinase [Urbifossiella limnaea]|uniref:2-amino-4-hydroxy-6-hydroxymethyldihydropteridine pyrophosphokinase n=1 Tax=Urbifossiella limnaea TaxID=2528023 RepID=A0A517XQ69_9BACT|nr:2-amino-4-hydroxy-6-hydroxymethyldihydropteridine diphosphokinase [Urbifossiella limnaea]QDU19657.1 3-oxoacyl-[acyl-carrier-protein] reductase FabG [Urbifossiella limnaea]